MEDRLVGSVGGWVCGFTQVSLGRLTANLDKAQSVQYTLGQGGGGWGFHKPIRGAYVNDLHA